MPPAASRKPRLAAAKNGARGCTENPTGKNQVERPSLRRISSASPRTKRSLRRLRNGDAGAPRQACLRRYPRRSGRRVIRAAGKQRGGKTVPQRRLWRVPFRERQLRREIFDGRGGLLQPELIIVFVNVIVCGPQLVAPDFSHASARARKKRGTGAPPAGTRRKAAPTLPPPEAGDRLEYGSRGFARRSRFGAPGNDNPSSPDGGERLAADVAKESEPGCRATSPLPSM